MILEFAFALLFLFPILSVITIFISLIWFEIKEDKILPISEFFLFVMLIAGGILFISGLFGNSLKLTGWQVFDK